MTRLYFVRHGESEANVQKVYSNRGKVHPLTSLGVRQANELARRLSEDPGAQSLRRIYTSPILRAVQTAEILAQALSLPVEETDALREFDCGVIEGLNYQQGGARYLEVRDDWIVRGLSGSRIEGGESLDDIRARFLPFIERLKSAGEDVVLVGHGGVYLTVLPDVVTNLTCAFTWGHGLGNTAAAVVEQRPEGLVCLSWGDLPLPPSGEFK